MNSKRNILTAILLLLALVMSQAGHASGNEEGVDVKKVLFHHLGDGYGWEVPFSHLYRIPLPVIVRAEDGSWHVFSSARLTHIEETVDAETGKTVKEAEPVIVDIDGKEGKSYSFLLAEESRHKDKVVQVFPLTDAVQAEIHAKTVATNDEIVDGYVKYDGRYYREYKPFDISITKNVLALLIASFIVTAMVMSLVRYYKRKDMVAPRKGMGFSELVVEFIYNGVIKATLGSKAKKYASFLLTCFFFILTMNLLGLIVIFPGGANLTGNIAVTIVLAVMVFVVVNINGSKHYWKEIFWPDVPLFLKFPLPIMQFIEIFGIFTKPAALCIRLFANMMGGHMIVLTLIMLIFIFAAFGAFAVGTSVVVSVAFTLFMLLIDVLVSFIQAFVFTLLATIFISMSVEEGHEEGVKHEAEEIDHLAELK